MQVNNRYRYPQSSCSKLEPTRQTHHIPRIHHLFNPPQPPQPVPINRFQRRIINCIIRIHRRTPNILPLCIGLLHQGRHALAYGVLHVGVGGWERPGEVHVEGVDGARTVWGVSGGGDVVAKERGEEGLDCVGDEGGGVEACEGTPVLARDKCD